MTNTHIDPTATVITFIPDINGNSLKFLVSEGVSRHWVTVRVEVGGQLEASYNYKYDTPILDIMKDIQAFIDNLL